MLAVIDSTRVANGEMWAVTEIVLSNGFGVDARTVVKIGITSFAGGASPTHWPVRTGITGEAGVTVALNDKFRPNTGAMGVAGGVSLTH